ncbi:hypothetical protein P153DRAFT_251278, partial [Dothidotthia symphoricarpi CBS 119687]
PPPCTCPDCQTYYYTLREQGIDRYHYTKVLADEEARALIAGHTKQIFTSQKYLRHAVQHHGEHILNRWRKRTQSKRKELLLATEPALPHKKGLVAELDYSNTSWQVSRAKYRKYFLLPYLDLETLANNPAALVGLIHARANSSPAEWAPFDHEQLRSSWGLGLLDAEFNAGAVIMFGSKYGTYTKWEAKAAHRFDLVGFPRAQQIFEAQATLMRFLQQVVEKLLEGLQDAEAVSAVGRESVIAPGLKMTRGSAAWSSFVHRPFLAPPRFDVDALLALVKARYDATSDHLWLLQTEPSYMKRYMRKLGQMESVQTDKRKDVGLAMINGEIIGDINIHVFWRMALVEFEHLQKVYRRYQDSIVSGAPLPKKIDDVLGALELQLVNQIHKRSKQLVAITSQRPGFRNIYDYEDATPVEGKNNKWKYEVTLQIKEQFASKKNDNTSGQARAYRTEKLWWILTQLQGPPDSETRFRYAMLLDMLDDHLASSTPEERARLDEILYENLSDYVTLIELLWAIRMHCPRSTIRSISDCVQTEDRIYWRIIKGRDVITSSDNISMIKSLTVFRATTPPSGQRNHGWLQQFDNLHSALRDYWRKTSSVYRDMFRGWGLSASDVELLMESLMLWDNSEYTSRLDAKREQVLADMRKPKALENEDMFLPLPTTTTSVSAESDVAQSKAKVKTRGESQPQILEKQEQAVEPQEPAVVTMELSKRSYATFRSMFPATAEERQKSTEWGVFVDSMADAGFVAKNGGGSIVTFEDGKGGGKIIFHRPHPEPSIDPVMLQSMGRRMNKWFGWTRNTFAL